MTASPAPPAWSPIPRWIGLERRDISVGAAFVNLNELLIYFSVPKYSIHSVKRSRL